MIDVVRFYKILQNLEWPRNPISWMPEGDDYKFFLRTSKGKYSIVITKGAMEDFEPEQIASIIMKLFEEVS